MNRNFHRIIFNAARGLRMVVQETARSTGRGARRATRGGAGASLGVAAALAALATSSPHAQIAADRGAPGTQRPTVLTAPNGVPLVNIQAPSAAGVSRNAYRQFDVGANGVVLNNSRTSVQSQLGGYVQGNPWLARGPARVIVNEVNSSNPTYLRGFVEVAGPRADVIIANPSGISINGGGFINAGRTTLTTGTPQWSTAGSLEGYVVRGGTVSIDGTGLDAGTTDSLAILARAFALSGALHAPALRVVAGANRIDADLAGIVPIAGTGAAPAYAIDVAHLGGMYAGHIALVVNEAGVGARNAGTIQTAAGRYTLAGSGPGVGRLTLSASGRLENSGVIQAASDAAIDAAGLANSGTVQGAAALRIATQGDLANHVGTTGGTLEAARLDLVSATGDIDNRGGTVRQASAAALTLTAGHLSNTGAGFVGAPPVPIAAATGPGTSAASGGNATVPAAGSGGGAAGGTAGAGAATGTSSTGSAAPAPAVVAPGSLTAAGGILNDGGKVHAGGDIVLRTPVVDNAGGVLDVASMALSGPAFSNAGGTLAVARGFTADVAGFDNTGGTLRAGTLAIATTGDLGNRGGTLASADAASLSVGGRLDNTGGTVSAVGALKATIAGALDNTSGRLLANAALAVAAGSLDNTLGAARSAGGAATLDVAGRIANDRGHIDAATDLALSAGALTNGGPGGGSIRAGRDGAIAIAGLLDNGNGSLTAGRHATIAAGSLASAAGGVLAAGIAADGSPAGPGDLSVTTGGDLSVNGTAIAAGRLALRGTSVDLTGAQVRGADIALAAATGDVTTRRATVATPGTLGIAATGSADAALVNEAGTLSAGRLDVQASNLRNTAGGRLAQTGGEALALGVAGTLDNTGGLVAGNGVDLALSGRRIVNAGGVIEHAGAGTLTIATATFDGARGRVTGDGDVVVRAGAFDQAGGTLAARGIDFAAGMLDNRGGQILQTGAGAARIHVNGVADNGLLDGGAGNPAVSGRIAGNGDLSVAVGELRNRGGSVRTAGGASLDLAVTALLDNGAGGAIGAGGRADVRAGRLVNDAGSITALGDLRADVAGALSNAGGLLGAKAAATVAAASLENTGGTVAAVQGDLSVMTTGATNNTAGILQAGGRARLVDAGLDNTRGKVTGRTLEIDTNGGALGNALGLLAASGALGLKSGTLDNDRGLVQSGGAMTIDTRGQALANTRAAGYVGARPGEQGGIVSGATLALDAGALDNTAGFISAKDALGATTGAFVNARGGVVLGQDSVSIATRGDAAYDNRGGQTLAAGDLRIDAGGGTVRNTGALIRSGGGTGVRAATVDNGATRGTDQGIEGRDVAITAAKLDNTAGAIRADADVNITSAGTVANAGGLMSAGEALSLRDPNRADPAARTLSVVNTGGQLLAGRSLVLEAAAFSGDGALTSGSDLSISLAQDLVNDATVSAAGDLSYATTGRLTNHGQLLAKRVLTVSGRDVENTASGVMRGDTTVVKAAATLTNHGLIDGRDTRIDAVALVNAPTGRIYGDHLSIAAGSVLNDGNGNSAGTLAAREALDIGAASLVNRQGALIFSGGDLRIGGALDADRRATGSAGQVDNQAATIEALGDMALTAGVLENKASGVTWTMKSEQTQALEFAVTQGGQRFKADEVFIATPNPALGQGGWSAVPGARPDTNDTNPRTVLLVPAPQYPLARFAAYYARSPARSVDTPPACNSDSSFCDPVITGAWYAPTDPIWSVFGVAAPVRELPADSPFRLDRNAVVGQSAVYGHVDDRNDPVVLHAFDHPVTQAEHDEAQAYFKAHAALDDATSAFTDLISQTRFNREYFVWIEDVVTQTPELKSSNASRIVAGGGMTLAVDSGVNDMGQILAGRKLDVTRGTIVNRELDVQTSATASGVQLRSYIKKGGWTTTTERRYEDTPFSGVVTPRTVRLVAARTEGDVAATPGHRAPDPLARVDVDAATVGTGGVKASAQATPVVEVALTMIGPAPVGAPRATSAIDPDAGRTTVVTATPAQPLVVRTATPDATIPQASLFRTTPGSSAHYLVETDPAFASYRQWLSSDYLLKALSYDPTMVTKRLGDGFQEQRLIREQVAQLTGYRFLAGFDSDEAEYLALMNAGRTFAQRFQLTPGIALTAAQMAQLTSDIVWLVEQTVTLADGSTERVLVPQVYVRVRPGDIDGSGALLSGETLALKTDPGRGDVVNTGTIAGRSLVSINADNIRNLGGRISSAGRVEAQARIDLDTTGGTIDANQAVDLKAGRDIVVASTTQSAANAQSTSTQLDRIAGVYVTNPGGTLALAAGRDVSLVGAILSNTGTGSTTSVKAGRDILLDTVKTSRSLDITRDEKNYVRTAESAEVGSAIITDGSTVLSAGNDIGIRQGMVSAEGTLAVLAGRDVNIESGSASQSLDTASYRESRGFLSSKSATQRDSTSQTTAMGSSLSGKDVVVSAGNDLTVSGSGLAAQDRLSLSAKRDVRIQSAEETFSQRSDSAQSRSGFSVSVLSGVSHDKSASAQNLTGRSLTQVGSTLSGGNVSIDGRSMQDTMHTEPARATRGPDCTGPHDHGGL